MAVEIHRTRIVSFPRSGHHWLVRSLRMNLPHMHYLEHHRDGRTLLNTPEAHVMKCHDFDLTLDKNPELRHVVVRRDDMWQALGSWAAMPENANQDRVDFILGHLGFACQWLEKWVAADVPNRIVVTYEEMCDNIESVVRRVLGHISDWDSSGGVLFEPFVEGGRHDV